jgi:hypothetical protein
MKKIFYLVLVFGLNIVTSQLLAQATKTTAKKTEASEAVAPPKELAPAVQIYFDNNKFEIKKEEASSCFKS